MFRCTNGAPDIMVAKDITGTDDHGNGRLVGDAIAYRYSRLPRDAKGDLREGRVPVLFLPMLHQGYNRRKPVPLRRQERTAKRCQRPSSTPAEAPPKCLSQTTD